MGKENARDNYDIYNILNYTQNHQSYKHVHFIHRSPDMDCSEEKLRQNSLKLYCPLV